MVVGGGLAGTCVVEALRAAGALPSSITWVRGAPSSGSSSTPAALLHALPGRSLDPKPGTMWAFERAVAAMERWRSAHSDLVWRGAMVRPKVPGRLGRRYVSTYRRGHAHYPDLMHHALVGGEELARRDAALAAFDSAIVYGPAFGVDLGALIAARARALATDGVGIPSGEVVGMTRADGSWIVRTSAGNALEVDTVTLCVGARLPEWLPDAELSPNGGELMLVTPPEDHSELTHAISGGGHVCPMPGGTWSVGATYLRPADGARTPAVRPDAEATRALGELGARLVPGVAEARVERVWRGTRLVWLGDRAPLCGALGPPGLFTLSALGSKGLLWAPGLADALAASLLGAPLDLPDAADLGRAELGAPRLDADAQNGTL